MDVSVDTSRFRGLKFIYLYNGSSVSFHKRAPNVGCFASARWPCGLMDKVLVFGTKDCRFESCQGHLLQHISECGPQPGMMPAHCLPTHFASIIPMELCRRRIAPLATGPESQGPHYQWPLTIYTHLHSDTNDMSICWLYCAKDTR